MRSSAVLADLSSEEGWPITERRVGRRTVAAVRSSHQLGTMPINRTTTAVLLLCYLCLT